MRSIFLALVFSCLSFFAAGQTFSYVKGTLDVTVRGFNPCGSPTPDNGYIEIEVNAASGGTATLIFISGLNSGISDAGIPIAVGAMAKYTFNNSGLGLPDDVFNFIIRDVPANTINTFATPLPYPPITLTDLPAVTLSEDIKINNTVCTNPTNGQIQSSISGGSETLAGGGSYTYVWKSSNGLPGLPTAPAITDGTTPLNLATTLGVPGLPGGNYSLEVTDNYGVCGTVIRNFTLTDPSPNVYSIIAGSPTTTSICTGDNITIALNNSDGASVTYEIRRNGGATGITFPGTGSGPFIMTFPGTTFSDGDVIQVRATDGFCSPANMTGAESVCSSYLNNISI
ncbi:MAG TPA: hypothetical protein PLJ60_20090 [Chryseolinea sp.]|nr:hypothetical protein [Chryseolinea sp.]